MTPITTNTLRADYERRSFSFGNPTAQKTIVLVGSCRIVPILNNLRVYNQVNGDPFELLCFDPVEMWDGPGCEVSDGANRTLADYSFGKVDFLVCEHIERCGVLNTVRSSEQNVFNSLGCRPGVEIRLPNWTDMHIFDAETAMHDPTGYGTLPHDERVAFLRDKTAVCKARFLSYCRECSFPNLEEIIESNWLAIRWGWTSSHPSLSLVWMLFNSIAGMMGIEVTSEVASHPLCTTDVYESTGMKLNQVDYDANGWKF
jgi:hypothetical protein